MVQSWKRGVVSMAALALVSGGALALGATSAAASMPVDNSAGASCWYAGQEYMHGNIINIGVTQQCQNGHWVTITP
jgi:hypothetical protein